MPAARSRARNGCGSRAIHLRNRASIRGSVEPRRGSRSCRLEAHPADPPDPSREPARVRPKVYPQTAPRRNRGTAACAPASRHSIYRARLTPGWPRSRQSRRNHRATPGGCPAMRPEEAQTTRRDTTRAAPRRREKLDPESRINILVSVGVPADTNQDIVIAFVFCVRPGGFRRGVNLPACSLHDSTGIALRGGEFRQWTPDSQRFVLLRSSVAG